MNIVTVTSVSKRFDQVQAVQNVSFAVGKGEIFGLLGPNGAGKTTTIRMMMDIFKADSGRIALFGGPLDAAKKRRIGYLPEERGLYKDQKLSDTLIFMARLKGLDKATAEARLQTWLERFDLEGHRDKQIQELSKGMQQKAQIIATLLHDPDLVVIDEPFSGLDPVNTRLVKTIFEEQRLAGKSIIMSTHQMHQVEALCNRIVLINNGRSVLYGEVEQLKRNYAGNALTIEGQGDFYNVPGVLETRQHNHTWHLSLAAETDPQAVLKTLVLRDGVKIAHFELAEPTLEDIFVSVVQGEPAAVPTPIEAPEQEVSHV